ncbi:MAG: hypothetical protein A2V79_10735 [Betaproteobacteria bacterium RBG_16_56_24]|nr:MAG: hypothetical protein A2V79_10735 [Betaproteobacteria bacterium RBG_16_56_24]
MRRFLFTRLLLIFALLFAHLGGLTHDISHALAEKRHDSDRSLPQDKHCDLCVAYAHIGGAIGSSRINFANGENYETQHLSDSSSYISITFVAFAARAPPCSA